MIRFTVMLAALLAAVSATAQTTNAQTDMKNEFQQIFPQGEPLPEQFSQFFTGQAYLAPVSKNDALGTNIANVTFSPACRNNWHSHTGGQLLICTAGRGFYQERGAAARELRPGDVVEIAPDVEHWHGAAPDSWFSHLAVECNSQTNTNTWLEPVGDSEYMEATAAPGQRMQLTELARQNSDAWLAAEALPSPQTDPELAEIFTNFAFDETAQSDAIDLRTRILVTMASAIAQNTPQQYRATLRAALANAITPVEIREVLYHAVPYVGMARAAEMLAEMNAAFTARGVALPLEGCATVTPENRMERGLELQTEIFGEAIKSLYDNSPADLLHIQRALSGNCFGDYQTRAGFGTGERELLTYAILISLGGCEAQVRAHIAANMAAGNGRDVLIAVTTQLLPYIGYPRTLNALACISDAAK